MNLTISQKTPNASTNEKPDYLVQDTEAQAELDLLEDSKDSVFGEEQTFEDYILMK
eukprot:CAMPEP_0168335656 /NCGR_PEP_ID=MMETSP0213-20121227/11046_1 /TAXON_ID=151035 /ORGANISM="Euplotes harpa, Strain FSP1.4" /LENGTH=55 /DNA_ID=CAMNT_0008340639 /DNA_START=503 /DNA_END=670 /DNA_ORIENTATION=+